MAEFSNLNGYDVKDKKAIRYYDTVADMKSDTTIKEGQTVATLGYYAVNDGGNSEYYITDEESNTEYQEELENGLFANLILDKVSRPEQFGAKGDGVNDDGVIINNALEYTDSLTFNNLKNYAIKNSIIVNDNKYINGNNCLLTISTNNAFSIKGDNNIIENFRLTKDLGNRYGIEILEDATNTHINNIYGDNLSNSLIMNDGINSIIQNCYAYMCGWDCVSNYTHSKNALIKNCNAIKCARHGFSTDEGADGIAFIDCYAEDIGSLSNEGHTCFHFEGATNSKIINCKAVYTENHPKKDNVGSHGYFGIRFDSANTKMSGNIVDGFDLIYENGFSSDDISKIVPLYFNSSSLSLKSEATINNIRILNNTNQLYTSILGLFEMKLTNFNIKGLINFTQNSEHGIIKEMINGYVDISDNTVKFYDGLYLVKNLKCFNVSIKNAKNLVSGRLVDCLFENCIFEDCETSLYLTQASGDSSAKSSGNIIRKNIFKNLTNAITLGWWTGTQNNIIYDNIFEGTMDIILKGNYSGCYFYDNLEEDLTYTTGVSNVTITTTPPTLTL